MAEGKGLSGIFGQFKKPFWVVNAFELFERGAYYGTMSVLGVHVTDYLLENDPSAAAIWGILYAMLIILLYFIPLLSGALAEKYGYRNVLIVSYGLMLVGYFTLSTVRPGNFGVLVFAFVMIGIGAGAFKPIISSTIAHVTGEEQRNLAYSIYYWMINLGATLVPLSIGLYTYFTFGVGDQKVLAGMGIYYFVGILSGILVVINTLILIFIFRDPIVPNKDLSVGNAFKRIAPAFKDKKFVVLLVIYSGFWFMFAYNHTFLPVLMVDFARMPDWFQLAFLATINPGTIIILGPFLGKFVEKYKSLNIMMTGILIFCLGLAINGFSNTPALFVIGIIIFSIGEFITHPGFISYVSKIAPKDKVTIYMGSIFISTGLGNAVGGVVHGFWYNYFARALFMPQVYVSLVITVGLITLVCFIFYNKWMISETLKADPGAKVDRSFWTKPVTAGVVCLFIPITIGSAFLGGTFTYYAEEDEVSFIFEENVIEDTESGYTNENNQADVQFDILEENYRLKWVNCTLTWQDEGSQYFRGTNEPDEFMLTLINPNGDTIAESSMSTSESVSVTTALNHTEENFKDEHTGTWMIVVEAGNCGDDYAIGGFRSTQDTGNTWSLQYSYTFLLEKKK